MDEIHEIEARLHAAQRAGDVDALDALLDERLRFVGPDGSVFGKAEDLALHRSGGLRFSHFEVDQLAVERFGATAITVVDARIGGVMNGQPFGGRVRYLRAWQRGEHGWRVIGGSVSLLPAESG